MCTGKIFNHGVRPICRGNAILLDCKSKQLEG